MTSVGICSVSIGISIRTTDEFGSVGRIDVVDWRPEWPDTFKRECIRLAGVFEGEPVEIEHVGSTSVPGLAAKPIIDICVGVERLRVVERRLAAFEALGYTYVPEHEYSMPERRYFRRPFQHPRTYHVHCFVLGSSEWNRHILFRDRLRASTALVDAYGELKRELARDFAGDRTGYTEAKSAFIASALSASTTL